MTRHRRGPIGIILIAAALWLAVAATSQAALSDNLKLYCPMNNITTPVQASYWQDVSGNGFHSVSNPPGYVGTGDMGGANRATAIDFTTIIDGQYNPNQITFADALNANLDPGLTDFSFSFWYNQTEADAGVTGTTRYLLSKGNAGSADPGFIVYTKGGAVSIRSNDVNGGLETKFSLQHTDAFEVPVNLAGTGWHHVTGVFDRSGTYQPTDSVTLYIDGSPVKTGTLPTLSNNVSAPTSPLYIGGKDGGVTKTADFEGYMDDIAFYRGALSPTQVQTLYTATSFDASTVSGVTPVFVHNFVTNANVDPAAAMVPDAYGLPNIPGTIHGDVTQVTDTTRGEVLSFNTRSLNNYVDFGDNLDPGATSYTVAMWVKRDEVPTSTAEFPASKGNNSTGAEAWSFGLRDTAGGTRAGALSTRANYTGTSTNRLNTVTESEVAVDTWHHVALVIDQTTGLFQAYIDGVGSGTDGDNGLWNSDETQYSVTFPADGTADFDTTVSLFLGLTASATGTKSGAFLGDIDDFAIWGRALTASEILAIYQGADIVTSVVIPGDADGNQVVDAADAQRLAQNWGATTLNPAYATWWEMGDFNADNKVNAADASILAANWGATGEAAAGVPEPGTLALLTGLVCLVIASRGRGE